MGRSRPADTRSNQVASAQANEGRKRRILELLHERGPISDEDLSTEVVGHQGSAEDVAPMTAELSDDGLIEPSTFAPRRWQITDKGRRFLGDDPGR